MQPGQSSDGEKQGRRRSFKNAYHKTGHAFETHKHPLRYSRRRITSCAQFAAETGLAEPVALMVEFLLLSPLPPNVNGHARAHGKHQCISRHAFHTRRAPAPFHRISSLEACGEGVPPQLIYSFSTF